MNFLLHGKDGRMLKPLSFTISGGAAPILPSVKQVAPKTWRISVSADAIWFLRLKVITTDQPRSQALDKVLRPPGFFTNIFSRDCSISSSQRQ